MGVNVVKGKRYVPLIKGEWTKNIKYESLTVVTYKGNSYTSKREVPIGVNITDSYYWCPTGIYNVQIENYRQEVKRLAERVAILENK